MFSGTARQEPQECRGRLGWAGPYGPSAEAWKSLFFNLQLIYNVVLISIIQQGDSVTHTHTHIYTHILLHVLFHYGLS